MEIDSGVTIVAVLGAGLAAIIIRVLIVASRPEEGKSGPINWGGILLALAAVGAGAALLMDTSVETSYGRVNNIGLMKDQQNYLMVCGVLAIIGTILLARRK